MICLFLCFLNWRIMALQFCVGFCHTSTWVSHRYTYVASLLNPPASPSHPPRLPQSTRLSLLPHIANSHWLSILRRVPWGLRWSRIGCMFHCYCFGSSLRLWICFCFLRCSWCSFWSTWPSFWRVTAVTVASFICPDSLVHTLLKRNWEKRSCGFGTVVVSGRAGGRLMSRQMERPQSGSLNPNSALSCWGRGTGVKGCRWTTEDTGFLAAGGEEFNPGPETRLDCSEPLCHKALLKHKRERENFWHGHQKGAEREPPC